MEPKGPPKTHDISHMFEPVDRRDIGGTGAFNAGVFIVQHRRTGKVLVEKRYNPDEVQNGGVSTFPPYTSVETSEWPCSMVRLKVWT